MLLRAISIKKDTESPNSVPSKEVQVHPNFSQMALNPNSKNMLDVNLSARWHHCDIKHVDTTPITDTPVDGLKELISSDSKIFSSQTHSLTEDQKETINSRAADEIAFCVGKEQDAWIESGVTTSKTQLGEIWLSKKVSENADITSLTKHEVNLLVSGAMRSNTHGRKLENFINKLDDSTKQEIIDQINKYPMIIPDDYPSSALPTVVNAIYPGNNLMYTSEGLLDTGAF